jgi:5-methylthioribose kinase
LNNELLDQATVVAYLKKRKIFSPHSIPFVEILTGGVSNVVLSISGEGKDLVLKQALPELRVATKWPADQRRAMVEARAIEAHLGQILGLWHRKSAADSAILQEFREDTLFEQLRIRPFYRTIAAKHESISERISMLIAELVEDKSCLVHGDYSPKNILAEGKSNVMVLDFEVAHTGNPVFDLGFFLAHLLCKYEFFLEQKEKIALRNAANAFINAYEESFGQASSVSLPWHVAAIGLARVDGQSPVNYLDTAAQERLRRRTLAILRSESTPALSEIFSP